VTGIAAHDLRYEVDGKPIIGGISLDFPTGTLTTIVGPNGAGKTTLLRMLSGVLKPSSGRVTVDGVAIRNLSTSERARRLAFLAPARIELPKGFRVEEVVGFGLFAHRRGWWSSGTGDPVVLASLDRLGLSEYRHRPIETLSDGERQRAWLAAIDAQGPEVVLLDEPTAHLDARHVAETLETLRAWVRAGRTCISVLHDLDAAVAASDRVVVLSQGLVSVDDRADSVANGDLERIFGVTLAAATITQRRRLLVVDYETRES